MFPQLVAGPIVRYEDIAREMESRTVTLSKIGEGAFQFAVGLGKKALLANNIGQLWTQIKEVSGDRMPAATAWLGILAFTFQIYFDFSGYSGGGGTSPSAPGSKTTSTFPWAAIGRACPAPSGTC